MFKIEFVYLVCGETSTPIYDHKSFLSDLRVDLIIFLKFNIGLLDFYFWKSLYSGADIIIL
jgi:hypothetical protein